mmetsp:Transcript_10608/g.27278  ORF Transcript_10608/g.27278 Transcript_10608/m.27278 type:complete len:203 (-) Transcript_10608:679-1287(-)
MACEGEGPAPSRRGDEADRRDKTAARGEGHGDCDGPNRCGNAGWHRNAHTPPEDVALGIDVGIPGHVHRQVHRHSHAVHRHLRCLVEPSRRDRVRQPQCGIRVRRRFRAPATALHGNRSWNLKRLRPTVNRHDGVRCVRCGFDDGRQGSALRRLSTSHRQPASLERRQLQRRGHSHPDVGGQRRGVARQVQPGHVRGRRSRQ